MAPFNALSNLTKHLRTHSGTGDQRFDKWWKKHEAFTSKGEKKDLSPSLMNLNKYFSTSNTALRDLNSQYLMKSLHPDINCPSYTVFRNSILPDMMIKFHDCIEKKLDSALSIVIVADIWTNKQNSDFIGIAAVYTNPDLVKEILSYNYFIFEFSISFWKFICCKRSWYDANAW